MSDELTTSKAGVPAELFDTAAGDFDFMDQHDLIVPRLSVMQGLSELVTEGIAAVGSIFDVTRQIELVPAGGQGVVIPLLCFKDWVEWNPDRSSEERILERSIDPQGQLAARARNFEMVTNSDGREVVAVTESYNFMVAMPAMAQLEVADLTSADKIHESLAWLSFSKTGHKLGKLWLNRLKNLKQEHPETGEMVPARMFSAAWTIESFKQEKEGNKWFSPRVGNYELLGIEQQVALAGVAAFLKERQDDIVEADTKAGADDSVA